MLAAVLRDSVGVPIDGREPAWRSSDPRVATVTGGTVTGVGVGTAEITATSERASATVVITVLPAGVARVAPRVTRPGLEAGEQASGTAVALDALGDEIVAGSARWSIGDAAIATVLADAVGSGPSRATVAGVAAGTTTLEATIDGVTASIEVEVRSPHAGHARIGASGGGISDGVSAGVRP